MQMVGTSVQPSSWQASKRPCPGDDGVVAVDQDRDVEAERLDAAGELLDLPLGVAAQGAIGWPQLVDALGGHRQRRVDDGGAGVGER